MKYGVHFEVMAAPCQLLDCLEPTLRMAPDTDDDSPIDKAAGELEYLTTSLKGLVQDGTACA